jgi:transcriptional regulator with XRE-family HTH domain
MRPKNPNCVAFGRAVRRFRVALGISQESLADLANIHRTYIGGIERGERNPTLTMIHRLAEALKVQPHRLIQTEDPEVINEGQ